MSPVEQRDIDSLKEWIRAEFKVVDTSIQSIERSIRVASVEQERRDEQLNDVRLRFIPRGEFEVWQAEQQRRGRAIVGGFITLGLALMGQAIAIIALLVK